MSHCLRLFVRLFVVVACIPAALLAQQSAGIDFFESKIRPVLAQRCYACHSAKAAAVQGGLMLDSRAALLKGGNSGVSIIPGDPDQSLLIRALRYKDEHLKMPPGKPLSPEQVADVESWVRMGAPDPRTGDKATLPDPYAKARSFWSFTKPSRAAGSGIDSFIEAKLAEKGLTLSPPADRRTLMRRVTFDLIGLPPSADEMDAFEKDTSPNAYERLVDRLLASPQYGERWARHWLDVARYSDTRSQGRRFPYSYTYRDWVIGALNQDMPYDRFVVNQVAADLVPGNDRKNLAALGFITLGRDVPKAPHDTIDDRIDVITRGLLGMTVPCARCHDHKFDPIPTKDYYSMYGVIANSEEPVDPPILMNASHQKSALDETFARRLQERKQAIADYRKRRHAILAAEFRSEAQQERYRKAAEFTKAMTNTEVEGYARDNDFNLFVLKRWRAGIEKPYEIALENYDRISTEGDMNNLRSLNQKLEDVQIDYAYRGSAPHAMALRDAKEPIEPHVFVRGNPNNPGMAVKRRFLTILSKETDPDFSAGSGRLDLARAIAGKDNPLTARVLVNRVWMEHFGEGIVRTPSDFGLRGDPPSHPELLDWLAVRFMEEGWSIKKLHRTILLSKTYRQASADNTKARAADPENVLLWRMNRRRIDFETLRDSMLAVAGKLDPRMGGVPFIATAQPAPGRRTVYAYIDRMQVPGMFSTFDFANPEQHSPKRYATTVPQQALFLINSPFVVEQARELAKRADGIEAIYRTALGRNPNADELRLGRKFAESGGKQATPANESPWQYGYGQFDGSRVLFQEFKYFAGERWLFSPVLPNAEAGRASLTATGGEPGDDRAHSVIRRWTAPAAGTIKIKGTLQHRKDKFDSGDGVVGRVVHASTSELSSALVYGGKADLQIDEVEVNAGDTIDFVVDLRKESANDVFTWAPVIEMQDRKWSAEAQFAGLPAKPLNVWEQYAQVLLTSNEFAFVD